MNRSSAGNTRGLIEAIVILFLVSILGQSSAGNTRGLIEAGRPSIDGSSPARLPRGIPAASLKPGRAAPPCSSAATSSAGNTRGLIEAWITSKGARAGRWVFRGEYPRPH